MIVEHSSTALKKITRFGLAGLTVGAISIYSLPAYAQVDEIIVSARKVEENLQDVPVSVTAATGKFLLESGVTEFPQIAQITPNFDVRSDEVRGEFAAVINIRGQNSTTSDLTIDQAVGININGAPVTRGTNLFGNLFDVEQVEILRGPQGTLFGKNTTGGTVIVTTKAPELGEFSGYGQVTAGNFNQLDFETVLNVPLGETAALRLGGAKTDRDGFGEGVRTDGTLTGNELANDDETFLRAALLIEPNDNLSVRINADYHDVDEAGGIVRALINRFPVASAVDASEDFFLGADFDDGVILPNTQNSVIADETNVNATVTANLGFAELTSVSSFRQQESETNLNYTPLGAIIIGQDSDLFAQEFRLAGDYNSLQWQAGVFYSKEEGNDRNNTVGRAQVTAVENEAKSIFAQGTYGFSDQLNLTAGIRYTDEDRGVELLQLGAAGGSIADAISTLGTTTLDDGRVLLNDGIDGAADTTIINDASFDDVSWTVALDYKLTDDVLTYASVSRGFRSGGIDGDGDLATEVDAETVLNYEVGLKGDFFDNTLRFNTAAWFSDYDDIQIQSFSLTDTAAGAATVPLAVLNNAASAELYGFEAELQWYPTEDFSLSLGAGLTEGEFQEFTEPRLVDPDDESLGTFLFDRSDEPVGGPEWQFNITPRYSFDVTENTRANIQFTLSHLDEQILASDEVVPLLDSPDQNIVEAITLVNGQIDFDIGEDMNVALWAKNLLDEEYFSTGFALGVAGGLSQRNIGAPGQYGVRIRKSF